jgi:hypothetical protein
MAVFTVEGDTERLLEAYDRALPEFQAAADALGAPQLHVCTPSESGLTIVDVWESGEALKRFSEHPRFGEILREAGLPGPSGRQGLARACARLAGGDPGLIPMQRRPRTRGRR